jgi:hypothetical protein
MPCDTFYPETSSDSLALWHVVYQLPMHMTTFSERFRLPLPSCGMTMPRQQLVQTRLQFEQPA